MCMVAYIASRSTLPLIPFQENAPAFNVTELTEHERPVLFIWPCRRFVRLAVTRLVAAASTKGASILRYTTTRRQSGPMPWSLRRDWRDTFASIVSSRFTVAGRVMRASHGSSSDTSRQRIW